MVAQKQTATPTSAKESSERAGTSQEGTVPEAAQGARPMGARSGSPLLRSAHLHTLQQTVGNQTVQRMLRGASRPAPPLLIQRILKVGVENEESYNDPQTLLNTVLQKGDGKYNGYKLLLLESLTAWINENKTFNDWQTLLVEVDKVVAKPGKGYIEMGNQRYTLIGTQHTPEAPDHSGKALPMKDPANSAMILEYTPLANSGRNSFNQEDVSKVIDNTQKPLAEYAIANSGSGMQMIGGDGRKAFDNDGKRHSLSLRNKEQDDYEISSDDLIDTQEVTSTFAAYADIAFQPDQDASSAIADIVKLVTYNDGTDQTLVLNQTINRLRALAQPLGNDKTGAIIQKAKDSLASSLSTVQEDYESDIHTADEMTQKFENESIQLFEQISQINSRNQQIQEEINKITSDLPQNNNEQPNLALSKLQEELSTNESKLFDLNNDLDYAQNYNSAFMKSRSLEKANQDIISSLHDGICNLLLFSEVLSVNKTNVVVGFGAEHIVPLKQLITKLKEADENNNV